MYIFLVVPLILLITPLSADKIATTCEWDGSGGNGKMNLNCPNGVIKITSTFYGRQDLSTCIPSGVDTSGFNVSCSSDTVFAKIKQLCDGKGSCTVVASNENFGDPCPGTWKYLRVAFYCQGDGGDTCGPVVCSKVNMPNIDYIVRGYNILKGNPLEVSVSIIDPGYQESIFELRYDKEGSTPDSRYLQPDGTLITMCESCDLSFDTKKMSGTNAYRQSLSAKVSVSVSEGGILGLFAKNSFSLSMGYKHVESHTSERSYLFTHSDASCCAYQIQTNTYAPPPFSEDFKLGMNSLTDVYDEAIYRRFIEAFGTHYVRQANMGSLYGQQCMISNESWESMTENGVNIEQTASLTIEESLKVKDDINFKLHQKDITSFNTHSSSQTLYTIGSKPPPTGGDVNTWVQETKSHPAPIKITLSSILDLLTHNDCGVSKNVLENMKKALTAYCGPACLGTNEDPPFPDASMWKPWLTNNYLGKRQNITKNCSDDKNNTNWITTFTSSASSLHWTCEDNENGQISGGNVGNIEITCPAGIKQMRAFVSDKDSKIITNLEFFCHEDSMPQYTNPGEANSKNGSWTNWISCNVDKKIMTFQTSTTHDDATELLDIRFKCF